VSESPAVGWIEVANTSPLVKEGYFNVAPVVQWSDNIQTLLSGSNNIMYDLDNDVFDTMTFNHDGDWSDFPEVGAVLRQNGYEELAICVAICPPRALWAVGMASKQRHRLQAARLSMCLALAANAESLQEVFSRNPEFLDFCRRANISVEDSMPNGVRPAEPSAPPSKNKRKSKKREYTQEEWDEWNAQSQKKAKGNSNGRPNQDWNDQNWNDQNWKDQNWKDQEWKDTGNADMQDDGSLYDPEKEPQMAPPVGVEEDAAAAEAEAAEAAAAVAAAEAAAAEAAEAEAAEGEAAEAAAAAVMTAEEEAEAVAAAKAAEASAVLEAELAEAERVSEEMAKEAEAQAEPSPQRPLGLAKKALHTPQQPVPRDEPLWLWLDELNDKLQGYSLGAETLALASDGSKRKGLYTQADKALQTLLGEESGQIVFLDDSDWTKFPCVGDALKTRGDKEECFTIAISPALSLWGIGVGMKGWVRHRAAKIALATVVAMQKSDVGEEVPDFSSAPAVADFFEEARQAKDTMLYS